MKKLVIPLVLLCLLVAGCSDKKEAPQAGPNLTQTPDVGKIEMVSVTAKGIGVTPGAAVNEALKSAIMQVNGARVASESFNVSGMSKVTADLDIRTSRGSNHIEATKVVQGQAFAEAIVSQSRGVVSSFKVLSLDQTGNESFTVEIEAQIAKYKAPEDAGKIKIVVAPLRADVASFDIGGRQIPAGQILDPIRQQIIDSLTQTGRFTVLDRQFEGELKNELELIGSGQTVNTDFAKLGQALSADIVWVGVVNNMAYSRQVRKSMMNPDRSVIGYAGGWSVSQRLINLATRQILQSNTLEGEIDPKKPSFSNTSINESQVLKGMEQEIAKAATEAIIQQTFPISVVQRDGNTVVLSQGGQAVRQNARYQLYLQGKEIKDPQTGQSLGNMETPCGEVVIIRVTPKLSYGVLENVTADLTNVQPGALLIKEQIRGKKAAPAVTATGPAAGVATPASPTGETPATVTDVAAVRPKAAAAKPAKKAARRASRDSDDW